MADTPSQSSVEEIPELSVYLRRASATRRVRNMPTEAGSNAVAAIKLEQTGLPSVSATVPARRPRRRQATDATKPPSSRPLKPTTATRVTKPSSRTPTGTKISSKKLRRVAEAQGVAAAAAAVAGDASDGDDNDNSGNGSNMSVAAFSITRKPVPPPQPAAEVFPILPDDANPIDRAIFERLALVWNEESGRWTREMQQSVLDTLPRARVTRSTVTFGNHYLSRAAREAREPATWGQFVALRAMFGPATCFRQAWAGELAARHPLAREDAYEGVVPEKGTAWRVLEGKAGMPAARTRKVSIMTLAPERSRRRGPTVKSDVSPSFKVQGQLKPQAGRETKKKKKEEDEEGGLLEELEREIAAIDEEEEGEEAVVSEAAWDEAAASAGRMDPAAAIARMRSRYREQEAEIARLRASNDGIRQALEAFTNMAAMEREA